MKKHLKKIMTEMCRRVGADYKKIDFKQEDWYTKYTWTEEQQDKFRDWLINYLKKNRDARTELLEYSNPKFVDRAVSWFLLDFGWKFKEKEECHLGGDNKDCDSCCCSPDYKWSKKKKECVRK